MKKIKLNDYFEFPMKLNMESYTLIGINKKESQNKKKGIK